MHFYYAVGYADGIHTLHVFGFADLTFENFPEGTQGYECMHAYEWRAYGK